MSWQEFVARHQPGDVIEGVVTKEMPFGSFVESEGFTGLAGRISSTAGTARPTGSPAPTPPP
jgi:hypothetical protein